MVDAAFPLLLSQLMDDSPLMVDEVEHKDGAPVTELPVTELLLLARLSRLPLLLSPECLWSGDVKPQWDEKDESRSL